MLPNSSFICTLLLSESPQRGSHSITPRLTSWLNLLTNGRGPLHSGFTHLTNVPAFIHSFIQPVIPSLAPQSFIEQTLPGKASSACWTSCFIEGPVMFGRAVR